MASALRLRIYGSCSTAPTLQPPRYSYSTYSWHRSTAPALQLLLYSRRSMAPDLQFLFYSSCCPAPAPPGASGSPRKHTPSPAPIGTLASTSLLQLHQEPLQEHVLPEPLQAHSLCSSHRSPCKHISSTASPGALASTHPAAAPASTLPLQLP